MGKQSQRPHKQAEQPDTRRKLRLVAEPRCETCQFWTAKREGDVRGNCYRYPEWWVKNASEWCGEYQPKGE